MAKISSDDYLSSAFSNKNRITIADLELVPSHAGKNTSHFITWGPDFTGQKAINNDGTFPIKGPNID